MSSFPEMEIDPGCSLLVNREVTLGKRELSMSCRCIGVKKGGGRGGRSWILLISTCLVYTNMKVKDWFQYDYYFGWNGYHCCGKCRKMFSD